MILFNYDLMICMSVVNVMDDKINVCQTDVFQ